MKSDTSDKRELISAKRREVVRRHRWVRMIAFSLDGVLYGLIACFLVALAVELEVVSLPIEALLASLLSAGLLGGALAGSLSAKESKLLLRQADRKLGLKDRVSTASELIAQGKHGGLVDLVVSDAARFADKIQPKRVYPLVLTGKSRFVPLAAVPVLALLLFNFNLPALIGPPVLPEVAEQGARLEEYGHRLADRAERESLPETLDFSDEIQRVGRDLQEQKISREESAAKIADLADRAQKLAQELAERMKARGGQWGAEKAEDAGDGKEEQQSAVRRVTGSGAASAGTGEELYGRIQDKQRGAPTPPGGAQSAPYQQPPALSGEDAGEGGADGESPATGEGEEGERDPADEESLMEEENDRLAQLGRNESELESLREAEERLRDSADSLESPDTGSTARTRRPPSSEGEEQGEADGDTEARKDGEGGQGAEPGRRPLSDAVGTAAVEDEKGRGDLPAQRPRRNITDLKGRISSEDTVRILIRSLPDSRESAGAFEESIQTYQKQIEETILKEDIPLGRREYIRDYFLLLGVVEEQ